MSPVFGDATALYLGGDVASLHLGGATVWEAGGGSEPVAWPTIAAPVARYEARLETGKTDGAVLTTVTDQSGAGHDLSAASTDSPVWVASSVNGRPAYRFDGTSDRSEAPVAIAGASALSLFTILSSGTEEATARGWPLSLATAATDIFGIQENTSEWGMFIRSTAGTLSAPLTSGVDTRDWCSLCLVWNGATATLYRNNVAVLSGPIGGTMSLSSIALGSGAGETIDPERFGGLIAVGAAWQTALTAAERDALHAYAADWYGL